MQTPHLSIPLLASHQAQKEVTVNEAIVALDALLNTGMISATLATPPASPTDGDVYIIPPAATGDWAGRTHQIAYYASGWHFITPREGLMLWVIDQSVWCFYDGSSWQVQASTLTEPAVLGVNTSADTTNRLAVRSAAVLVTADESGSVQAKINKQSSAHTASFLWQTGFSTRAEVGLAGDDQFSVKVSPDGGTFHTIYQINPADTVTTWHAPVHMNGMTLLHPALRTYSEEVVSITATGSSCALNLSTGKVFDLTLEASCTLDFTLPVGGADGFSFTLILRQDATGGHTITWPSSVKWSEGTAPSLDSTASTTHIVSLMTTNHGTDWFGFIAGENMQ